MLSHRNLRRHARPARPARPAGSAATLTERRRRVVALYCPGWPPRLAQNGIVSYIGNLRPGLERAGVTARVLTGVVNSDSDEDRGAVDLADASPPRALQALVRAGSRRLPFHPLGVLLGCSVARGLEEIKRRHGLDLFEMEESFGVPMYVQQLVDVPVVVRLHGPRFVQGPAQGLPIDDEFHRIDRIGAPLHRGGAGDHRPVAGRAVARAPQVRLPAAARRGDPEPRAGDRVRATLVAGRLRPEDHPVRGTLRPAQGRRSGDRRVSKDRARAARRAAGVRRPRSPAALRGRPDRDDAAVPRRARVARGARAHPGAGGAARRPYRGCCAGRRT